MVKKKITKETKIKQEEPKVKEVLVDFSKYDNYKEFPDGHVQFINPFTGREIAVPRTQKKCPFTNKLF